MVQTTADEIAVGVLLGESR